MSKITEKTSQVTKSKRGPFRRIVLRILLSLLLCCIVVLVLLLNVRSEMLSTKLLSLVSRSTGLSISAEESSIKGLKSLRLKNAIVKNGDRQLLRAEHIEAKLSLIALFKYTIQLRQLEIQGANLDIARSSSGKWNFEVESAVQEETKESERIEPNSQQSSALPLRIDKVRIQNSNIRYSDETSELTLNAKDIALSLDAFRAGATSTINLTTALQFEQGNREGKPERSASAQLDLQGSAQIAPSLMPTLVQAALKTETLDYQADELRLKEESLRLDVRATQEGSGWNIEKALLTNASDQLRLHVAGKVPLASKGMAVRLELKEFQTKQVQIPQMFETESAIDADLHWKGTPEAFTLKGSLQVSALQGRIAQWQSSEPSNCALSLDARREGTAIELGSSSLLCSLTTASEDTPPLVQTDLSGSTNLGTEELTAELALAAKRLDLDGLQKLFVKADAPTKEEQNTEVDANDSTAEDTRKTNITAQLKVDELILAKRTLRDVNIPLQFKNGALSTKDASLALSKDVLRFDASFDTTAQQAFTIDLNAKTLSLTNVTALVTPQAASESRGELTRVAIDLRGYANADTAVNNTLYGTAQASFSDIYFDKGLSTTPPFSLLFIPVRVVGTVAKAVPTSLLPDTLKSLFSSIGGKVSDVQTFHLSDGALSLVFEGEELQISEMIFGMDLLPKVYFGGKITKLEDIEIDSGVTLLSARIPLPITGSLSRPYPDIKAFTKALFTQFGMSIVRMPMNLLGSTGDLLGLGSELQKDEMSTPQNEEDWMEPEMSDSSRSNDIEEQKTNLPERDAANTSTEDASRLPPQPAKGPVSNSAVSESTSSDAQEQANEAVGTREVDTPKTPTKDDTKK